MTELYIRFNGEDFLVIVLKYVAPTPSNPNVDPLEDPYDPGEFEFKLFDTHGNRRYAEEALIDQDYVLNAYLKENER